MSAIKPNVISIPADTPEDVYILPSFTHLDSFTHNTSLPCSVTHLNAHLFVVAFFLFNIPVLASKAEPVHILIMYFD